MNDIEKADQHELSLKYDSSHIERIVQHLSKGGEGVELTAFDNKILDRLIYADEAIRQNQGKRKRGEIANMIKIRFGVSRATAFQDIVNAEHVFASSYPINKKYRIGLRIEFLEDQIRQAANDKQYDAVARMEKVLLGYYELYPDAAPPRVKKNIIMNIIQNHLSTADNSNNEMKIEEALIVAENITEDE